MIKNLTKENISSELNEGRILLDFWAEWCQPCRHLADTIDAIKDEINVGKINSDEENELVQEYSIRQLPTLILIEDGKVIKRTSGNMSKQQLLEFYATQATTLEAN